MIVSEKQPDVPGQPHVVGRGAAAVYFKNAVLRAVFHSNGPPTYNQSAWFLLDFPRRELARGALLNQVVVAGEGASSDPTYMKDLSLMLSTIGLLELQSGEWPDFVGVMAGQASQDEHAGYRRAAVQILGLLVEALGKNAAHALSDGDLG